MSAIPPSRDFSEFLQDERTCKKCCYKNKGLYNKKCDMCFFPLKPLDDATQNQIVINNLKAEFELLITTRLAKPKITSTGL